MIKKTVDQIKKKLLLVEDLNDPFLATVQNDPRKGVQAALRHTYKKIQQDQRKLADFRKRFKYENQLHQKGFHVIAGVDEVGRGPLAGPVIACAIILPDNFDLIDVNDSKQLSKKQRELLYPKILQEAVCYGIGTEDSQTTDKVNIYQATRLAMKQAVLALKPKPDQIIVDAMQIPVNISQTRLIKGDAKSISVAAASIVAKVYRDNLMVKYSKEYPGYGFEKNAGYGTKLHLKGLQHYGVTPIHRKTFSPVEKYL
mgnify:CR=1 FL=1